MDFFSELYDFVKEILGIPKEVLSDYYDLFIRPGDFFVHTEPAINWKYFGAGLGLMSFLFSYTVPKIEYTSNPVFKWLIQVPMGKISGLISRGGILYLTALMSIPILVVYVLYFLFNGAVNLREYLTVLFYSMGTVYFTFSFVVMAEHLAMKAVGKKSVLLKWKLMIELGESKNKKEKNESADIKKTISFREKSRIYAEDATERASGHFLKKLTLFQRILLCLLSVYGLIFPLVCLFRGI